VSPNKVTPIWERLARLPLTDPESNFLYWVDDERARDLVSMGKARFLRTKKKIRGVELVPPGQSAKAPASKPIKPTVIRKRGTTGDSHRQERTDNPAGVWTIDRVARNKRNLFLQVVTDCSERAA
jgi:hypothetical protein